MRFEYFCGEAGGWYWRLRAGNGKVVADGSEMYFSASNVRRAIRRVQCALFDRVGSLQLPLVEVES